MKKLLSILGAISLVGTSTTSLVGCNKSNEYTAEQLKELKEKNKIDTKNKEIRDNLEWMASQEKPFNNIDNKYYYVVWKGKSEDNWRIIKFKNSDNLIKIDNFDKHQLEKTDLGMGKDLYITNDSGFIKYISVWKYDDGSYFKYIYRWNLTTQDPDLIIDDNGNVKVKGE